MGLISLFPTTPHWNAGIKKAQIKWHWQILVQGRFVASTYTISGKGQVIFRREQGAKI